MQTCVAAGKDTAIGLTIECDVDAGIFPTARFDHKSANLEADFSSHKSETTASAEFIALFEPSILKHHAASYAYADGVDPALREIEQM